MSELQEFHEEFFNEININATASNDFLQRAFFEKFCEYLDAAGEIEVPIYSYYKDINGRGINGYYLNDDNDSRDGSLNLFITAYSASRDILNINKDEILSTFKRLEKFFIKSINEPFYEGMEESSDGYEVARFIYNNRETISNANLFLLTDKQLSSRLSSIDTTKIDNVKINYHLWDINRLYRMISSERASQDIIIDFKQEFGDGLACLPAKFDDTEYKAYLAVVPGEVLAKLYEKYGARLLERNVRSFLQAKGKVNMGIRKTILTHPGNFFAFNNGITATAEDMEFDKGQIRSLTNLQIVNGGQTTASLFNTFKRDKADLSKVFVQMKLSVVSQEIADELVPDISKYANSQNKVNESDFFATHPFHKRLEEFSRRILTPNLAGQLTIQTKWFYERSRGQYTNGYIHETQGGKKKFQTEYPKAQLFTKTDLAKFEGVWLQLPHIVSKGAQYIFLDYAEKIDDQWKKDNSQYNDVYFKIAIAKAIIFKATEKIISSSSWYDGGYRANIVAYGLSYIAYRIEKIGVSIDFIAIWNKQAISKAFERTLCQVTEKVQDKLINNGRLSNIGQYCKKPIAWDDIKKIDLEFSKDFIDELLEIDTIKEDVRIAKSKQKSLNQIAGELQVVQIGETNWKNLIEFANSQRIMITPKEEGILNYYFKYKYLSSAQSKVILSLLERMEGKGFILESYALNKEKN